MKSLHEELGAKAVPTLQNITKGNVIFPEGFDIKDKGNHYIVSKGKSSMKVGLYCVKDVFKALNLFT